MSANVRHSSETVEHYSPVFVVEAARAVLGRIDLDPASCELANRTVRASRIFTREDDGFARAWINPDGSPSTVYLNPPGGKDGNESVQKAWWFKLASEYAAGNVEAAIFVGFSIEILQTTQVKPKGRLPLDFPFCIPSARIPFSRPVDPNEDRKQPPLFPQIVEESRGVEEGTQPPHANVIVYLPKTHSQGRDRQRRAFAIAFAPIGRVVRPGVLYA